MRYAPPVVITWPYENGMVKGGSDRVIYDELMAAPEHERCWTNSGPGATLSGARGACPGRSRR